VCLRTLCLGQQFCERDSGGLEEWVNQFLTIPLSVEISKTTATTEIGQGATIKQFGAVTISSTATAKFRPAERQSWWYQICLAYTRQSRKPSRSFFFFFFSQGDLQGRVSRGYSAAITATGTSRSLRAPTTNRPREAALAHAEIPGSRNPTMSRCRALQQPHNDLHAVVAKGAQHQRRERRRLGEPTDKNVINVQAAIVSRRQRSG